MMTQRKLDDEIQRVLHPKTAWKIIKDLCDESIAKAGKSWRINDDKGEGVLFVNRSKPTLVSYPKQLPMASINKRNLEREVGLSYSLFNARSEPVDGYQFISWESRLLRRTSKSGLEILDVKCDLIAYNARRKELVAVEVKLEPDNDATSIQHGLLQGMAYGHLLRQCLKKNKLALEQQVANCLCKWCHQENPRGLVEKVSFAIAAPREYFSQSLDMLQWARKLIRIKDVPFNGFWVIDYKKIHGDSIAGHANVIPKIECSIKRLSTVTKLEESLS